jgi:hypothetical protein
MAKKKAKKQSGPNKRINDLESRMEELVDALEERADTIQDDFEEAFGAFALVDDQQAGILTQHQKALETVSQLFARLEKKIDSIQSGVADLLIDWIARVVMLETKLATLFPATFGKAQSGHAYFGLYTPGSSPEIPHTATAAAARSESEQGEPETNVYIGTKE